MPLKNMSQALNINDPCQLKQLMTKATWINFIIFHKINLKELCMIIQNMC